MAKHHFKNKLDIVQNNLTVGAVEIVQMHPGFLTFGITWSPKPYQKELLSTGSGVALEDHCGYP